MNKLHTHHSNSSRNPRSIQGRLFLLILSCILVFAAWGVSTIWLRHLTSISYTQIARLEAEKQDVLRRAATLNNGIAYALSPENMRNELMKIGSDLRLPTSNQVIRVNSSEILAANPNHKEPTSFAMALWDQPNP